ncbi:MAG: MFS family permease [Halieaceae bacterium]
MATSALWVCFMSDALSPVGLLALISLLGVGSALRMPNVAATVSELVPRNQLTAALSLSSAVISGSRMIGPAIAGLLLSVAGVGGVLGINLILLLLASIWLKQLPASGRQYDRLNWAAFKVSLIGGFRMMAASREQRSLLLMTSTYAGSLAVIVALLPVLASNTTQYGLMYSCYGAGAMCGAAGMATLRSNLALAPILRCAVLASVLALLVLAAVAYPVAQGLALVVAGASWVAVLNAAQVHAALALNDSQRGRGLSFLFMAAIGGMALASPIWGWLAKVYSVQLSFLLASLVVGGLFLVYRFPSPSRV